MHSVHSPPLMPLVKVGECPEVSSNSYSIAQLNEMPSSPGTAYLPPTNTRTISLGSDIINMGGAYGTALSDSDLESIEEGSNEYSGSLDSELSECTRAQESIL